MKKWLLIWWIFLCLPLKCIAVSLEPLPADEVYHVGINVFDTKKMLIVWQIAPGYYLYRDRLQVSIQPKQAVQIQYPQGEFKYNKTRGRYEAYVSYAVIPVIFSSQPTEVQLTLDYQGCSQDGFCYPPMQKKFNVNFTTQLASDLAATPVATVKLSALVTDQNRVALLFEQQSYFILLLIFVGLGLLLAFTPCVFPLIPILMSIIVGQRHPVTGKKAFLLSLSYVFGSACTYALAGLMVAMVGSSIQIWLQQSWVLILASAIFILLALSLFGLYELRLPSAWQTRLTKLTNQYAGRGYLAVAFMGMLSTLIISPCVTAPLVGVLMFVARSGNAWLGASALFMLGIGMGLPLLMIGTSAGKLLPKSGAWMRAIRYGFGLAMIGVALLLVLRVSPMTFHIKEPSVFTVVADLGEWEQQLAKSKAAQRPVLLDFYADWCESCVEMDKTVFNQSEVMKALQSYDLVRVDLSEMNRDEAALLKRYQVVAPPTLLIFDRNGKEETSQRMVGEMTAQQFLQKIQRSRNE